MISAIGYMVGAYIFTRMVELVTREDERYSVFVFALLTAAVALICIGLIAYQDYQAGQAATEAQRNLMELQETFSR